MIYYNIYNMEKSTVRLKTYSPYGEGTGFCTGFCIKFLGKKYIMSCYHCVEYTENILITTVLSTKEYTAKSVYVYYDNDLALFVSDVCELLTPLTISKEIPETGSQVKQWSFQPANSGGLSEVHGRFRSIDNVFGIFGYYSLLRYRIDIISAQGDSGSALLNANNEIIGIASFFTHNPNKGSKVEYYITNIEIDIFLNKRIMDFALKKVIYKYAFLDIIYQSINKSICRYLNYKENHGLLIRGIRGKYYNEQFKINDILVKINNYIVLKDATVNIKSTHFVNMQALIKTFYYPYTEISVTVFRDNKYISFKLTLQEDVLPAYAKEDELISKISYYNLEGINFKYYIVNGDTIFQNRDIFEKFKCISHTITDDNIKLIYVSNVIYNHKYDIGRCINHEFLKSVNNIIIKDLEHLEFVINDIVKKKKEDYLKFEFYGETNKICIIYVDDLLNK